MPVWCVVGWYCNFFVEHVVSALIVVVVVVIVVVGVVWSCAVVVPDVLWCGACCWCVLCCDVVGGKLLRAHGGCLGTKSR
jgi:hypothetical protein